MTEQLAIVFMDAAERRGAAAELESDHRVAVTAR